MLMDPVHMEISNSEKCWDRVIQLQQVKYTKEKIKCSVLETQLRIKNNNAIKARYK